ncbi:Hypothetical_protein [Hexamita inflata]|uniref:Hypothetical_protein n=1 Tax=Hexamita inflata TaxID=28002 RepID=A0AA86P191_9EUKA|nr:Hypothetical protein HINF_LOCUS16881 [Hexamita inflata]CAI9929238.1 Hypothetical protein HINF_LOCUS16883 [Hexamita inflata]
MYKLLIYICGRLAQPVERLSDKQKVLGSIPRTTKFYIITTLNQLTITICHFYMTTPMSTNFELKLALEVENLLTQIVSQQNINREDIPLEAFRNFLSQESFEQLQLAKLFGPIAYEAVFDCLFNEKLKEGAISILQQPALAFEPEQNYQYEEEDPDIEFKQIQLASLAATLEKQREKVAGLQLQYQKLTQNLQLKLKQLQALAQQAPEIEREQDILSKSAMNDFGTSHQIKLLSSEQFQSINSAWSALVQSASNFVVELHSLFMQVQLPELSINEYLRFTQQTNEIQKIMQFIYDQCVLQHIQIEISNYERFKADVIKIIAIQQLKFNALLKQNHAAQRYLTSLLKNKTEENVKENTTINERINAICKLIDRKNAKQKRELIAKQSLMFGIAFLFTNALVFLLRD